MEGDYPEIHDEFSSVHLLLSRWRDESDPSKWTYAGIHAVWERPSKEELLDLLDNIHRIAEGYGIHINKKKTRIVKISSTYKFLQIKYSLTNSGKIIKRINPKRVTTMRRKLKKLAVKVKNEEISYENVENMFRGWMGGFYKLLSREQRKNLIGLYEDLFEKSITIVNKKIVVTDKIK